MKVKKPQSTLSFGNYAILERLAAGERMPHVDGTLWMLFEASHVKVSSDQQLVQITNRGLDHLRRYTKPEFPKSKTASDIVSDLVKHHPLVGFKVDNK